MHSILFKIAINFSSELRCCHQSAGRDSHLLAKCATEKCAEQTRMGLFSTVFGAVHLICDFFNYQVQTVPRYKHRFYLKKAPFPALPPQRQPTAHYKTQHPLPSVHPDRHWKRRWQRSSTRARRQSQSWIFADAKRRAEFFYTRN
jgi:hypothetical protein